ncbi:MAG: DUF2147 domain-containing protein [Pseudomonadota bacterium]
MFASLLLLAAAGGAPTDPAVGTWTNPKGSLQVRTRRCGEQLCGAVVAASPKAIAKAQKAGVPALIGTEVFREYRRDGATAWAGTLYIPDKHRTVSSTLQTSRGDTLKVSGCLIGRILCKTQVWTRADARVAAR